MFLFFIFYIIMNNYFDKIYIINLHDKIQRFKKVSKQFIKNNIKFTRFEAIDGRCKKYKCAEKKRELQSTYNVKISKNVHPTTASLVIGTKEILKNAIKKKYKRILICEDDIVFSRNINTKFKTGIKELKQVMPDWDLLYLGSGNQSGINGISYKKTTYNKYKTCLYSLNKDYDWYVHNKLDLRFPAEDCEDIHVLSPHLSIPYRAGGGWCYAFSLKGMKKIYKYLKNINDHIDQIIPDLSQQGILKTVAFDEPIVFHEDGAFRSDSDIKWNW